MTELKRGRPPKVSGEANKEIQKIEESFTQSKEAVSKLTLDTMNKAPIRETEPQTKLSTKEIQNAKEIYLKPVRAIGSQEKFNEKWRQHWEYAKQNTCFIAENKEQKGEPIELWTKPYPGVPAQFWVVPVNKPVWGPRHLAEQISTRRYHKIVMNEQKVSEDNYAGKLYGVPEVETTENRLDAKQAPTHTSVFMGDMKFVSA